MASFRVTLAAGPCMDVIIDAPEDTSEDEIKRMAMAKVATMPKGERLAHPALIRVDAPRDTEALRQFEQDLLDQM